jgi:hypothetical protein
MIGTSSLMKGVPGNSLVLLFFIMWGQVEKTVIYGPGSRTSKDRGHAGT